MFGYVRWYRVIGSIALGFGAAAAFSLATLALLAAVGQWAALAARRTKQNSIALAWFARLGGALAIVTMLAGVAAWKQESRVAYAPDSVTACNNPYNYDPPATTWDWLDCDKARSDHIILRISETLETAVMPLVDSGTLLTLNLMEINATELSILRTLFSGLLGLGLYFALTVGFLKWSSQLARSFPEI